MMHPTQASPADPAEPHSPDRPAATEPSAVAQPSGAEPLAPARPEPAQPASRPLASGQDPRPAESFLLADIERSRDYRKEYYKYAIGIATSLLAFTLAFQPTLRSAPQNLWMEIVGWIGLGIAAAAGVRVHMTWAEFFITFRDFDNKGLREDGKKERGRLTSQRRFLEWLMIVGLVVGVAGVIGFTASNLHNVALKTTD
jgi:hypothetical protein